MIKLEETLSISLFLLEKTNLATATYKCPKCDKTKQVVFKPGFLIKVECEDCNEPMTREWKNVGVGTVVDDKQIQIDQMMLKSGMRKSDKVIF